MFELIRANRQKTALLVVVMAALLVGIGWAIGVLWLDVPGPDGTPGRGGLVGIGLGLALWVVLTLVAWFAGDSIFLALAGARKIEKDDHPVLWNVVEEMCIASGVSTMPKVYIIDRDDPNAFATGRSPRTASVAVTAGLLERLDRDELQGVVAHEMAHVGNRDVLFIMMIGVMVGSIAILGDLGRRGLFFGGARRRTSSKDGGAGGIIALVALVLVLLAPFVSQLVYLAISRRREYLADACAAQFTRYPEGLARALEKIASPGPVRGVGDEQVPIALRSMAPMYIVPPRLAAGLGGTHPPIEERIDVLRGMVGEVSVAGYDAAFRKVTGRPVGVVPARVVAEAKKVPARAPSAVLTDHLDRVRAATDALWHAQQFLFVACACGTTLKIPPSYAGRPVACPHCAATHTPSGPV